MPPILMASPVKTTLLKLEREVSMTMEVRESPVSGDVRHVWSHVRELNPQNTKSHVVILTPPPHKLRDLSSPVDTSSQVSTPDDC